MNKAIFLDRDGVINQKRSDYVKNLDELKILPNVPEAIKKLNNKGYLVIIITNQSAVNRKIISEDTLLKINEHMISRLKSAGAKIDAIYYCPHTPEEKCNCRKPQPSLILKAIEDLKIDKSQSILIGDTESDIEAARRAGVESWQMKTDSDLLELINKRFST